MHGSLSNWADVSYGMSRNVSYLESVRELARQIDRQMQLLYPRSPQGLDNWNARSIESNSTSRNVAATVDTNERKTKTMTTIPPFTHKQGEAAIARAREIDWTRISSRQEAEEKLAPLLPPGLEPSVRDPAIYDYQFYTTDRSALDDLFLLTAGISTSAWSHRATDWRAHALYYDAVLDTERLVLSRTVGATEYAVVGRNTPSEWLERLIGRYREVMLDALRRRLRSSRGISAERIKADKPTRQDRGLAKFSQHDMLTGGSTARLERYLASIHATASNSDMDDLYQLPAVLESAGIVASRTWGIEIELAGARGVGTPHGWGRKYDGSLVSAYSPLDMDECQCDEDCVHCREWGEHEECDDCAGREGPDTGEFVSPILHTAHEPGVGEICQDARFEPQNDSAGIHIHVGAEDLTPKQVGGLVYAYSIIEPMLEVIYQRNTREYCKSLRTHDLSLALKSAKEARNARDVYVSDRYVTLNLQALMEHGTVEFRGMGPVYDAPWLHRWALFCREMVNCAANNAPQKRWDAARTFADVIQVFRDYGTELNVHEAVVQEERELVASHDMPL